MSIPFSSMASSRAFFPAIISLLIISLQFGCQSKPAQLEPTKIIIDGSSSTFQAVESLKTRIEAGNKQVIIENIESGSKQGMQQLIEGKADIARTSYTLSAEDLDKAKLRNVKLEAIKIGYDALAIVTHPERASNIKGLTFAQARGIFFDGSITEWSALSPSQHGRINVLMRDGQVSGTISWLALLLTGNDKTPLSAAAKILRSPRMLREQASRDPSVITVLPLSYLDRSVSALAVGTDTSNLTECNLEQIAQERYPFVRALYFVTNGPAKGAIKQFIDFTLSSEGQEILSEHGILRLDQLHNQ